MTVRRARLRDVSVVLVLIGSTFSALLVAHDGDAQADEMQSATVVVFARAEGPLGKRVAAELAAMGLTVRMRALEPATPLDDAARALRVDGAVRVSDSDLEVWLVEPGSARTVLEKIPLGTTDTQQITAVHRATEVLRTQLLEPFLARAAVSTSASTSASASASASTSASTIAIPRDHVAREPQSPSRRTPFGFWIAPGIAWTGPVTQSSFDIASGAYVGLVGPLVVEAMLTRSLIASTVTATAGHSDLETWTLGLDARLRHAGRRFGVSGGVGVAGVWLLLTGHATSPYVSSRADVFTAMPFAVVGVDVAIGPHLALRADALVGFTAPRASIVFADQPVADWGLPFVMATLGVEARWP